MISATAEFATPSSVNWPLQQVSPDVGSLQFELMIVLSVDSGPGFDQPAATTYQSGSPAASTNFSDPIVRQGKRPTTGSAHEGVWAFPSVPVPLLKLPGASGQGKAPGLFSPLIAA